MQKENHSSLFYPLIVPPPLFIPPFDGYGYASKYTNSVGCIVGFVERRGRPARPSGEDSLACASADSGVVSPSSTASVWLPAAIVFETVVVTPVAGTRGPSISGFFGGDLFHPDSSTCGKEIPLSFPENLPMPSFYLPPDLGDGRAFKLPRIEGAFSFSFVPGTGSFS